MKKRKRIELLERQLEELRERVIKLEMERIMGTAGTGTTPYQPYVPYAPPYDPGSTASPGYSLAQNARVIYDSPTTQIAREAPSTQWTYTDSTVM